MRRISIIHIAKVLVLILSVFNNCEIFGQDQYSKVLLRNPNNRILKMQSNTYISFGSLNTSALQHHHMRLYNIPVDTNAYVRTQFEAKDSNDFFVGMFDPSNSGYYGFLFKDDSCFYYHDQTFEFKHIYNQDDTFKVVRCDKSFLYSKNEIEDFSFPKDIGQPMEVIIKNNYSSNTLGYIEYQLTDSCSNIEEPISYYILNLTLDGSYTIVKNDTVNFKFTTNYQIDSSSNQYFLWTLYDSMHMEIASDSIRNEYGAHQNKVDLSPYNLNSGSFYDLRVHRVNKNREYFLRFKYLVE